MITRHWATAVEKLLADPETSEYITGAESDLTLGVMNFDTRVDRDAAAAAGLTANDIATNLAASLAPYRVTKIRRKGRTYDVYVQMPLEERPNPSTFDRLYIRNADDRRPGAHVQCREHASRASGRSH